MSWVSKGLKKLGKGVKKVAKGAGKVWEKIDDVALPAVGFALGGPAGVALGSAAARGIGDGKFNAKATLGAGIKGYALGGIGQAAGAVGGKGFEALGSSLKTMGASPVSAVMNGGRAVMGLPAKSGAAAGGVPQFSDAAQRVLADPLGSGGVPNIKQLAVRSMTPGSTGGMVSRAASGGGAMDMLKNVGNFALKNNDLLLGGLAGYEGYQNDKRADALRKQRMQMAMGNWNTTAPLRAQGQAQMLDQSLEAMPYARNRYNPFSA